MCTIYDAGSYLGMLDGLIAGKYLGLLNAVLYHTQKKIIDDSEEFVIPSLSIEIVEQAIIQTRYREPIEQYLDFCEQMDCVEAHKPFKRKMSGMEPPDFMNGYNNTLRDTVESIYNEWYDIGLSIADEAYDYIIDQVEA